MRILFLLLIGVSVLNSQNSEPISSNITIDSLYREDQFYIGIQNCILNNKPSSVSEQGLSLGFHAGFIRDFPLNEKRTVAIGTGLGYAFKNYNTSLATFYSGYGEVAYFFSKSADKNYLRMQSIEMPLEFRWRTSTFDSHKFWRIYTGVRLSYLLHSKSYYSESNAIYRVKNNPDLRRINTSVYTSIGWNTWNLYVNYGLSTLFRSPSNSLEKVSIVDLGVIFYIL